MKESAISRAGFMTFAVPAHLHAVGLTCNDLSVCLHLRATEDTIKTYETYKDIQYTLTFTHTKIKNFPIIPQYYIQYIIDTCGPLWSQDYGSHL